MVSAVLKVLTPVCCLSQSMALYWFCSSLVGLGHQLFLRSPSVHQLLRLPGQRSQNPYRDLLAALVQRLTRRPGK